MPPKIFLNQSKPAAGYTSLTLMFLLTLTTILLLEVAENSWLEHQIESAFEHKIRSFYLAENCLLQAEAALLKTDRKTLSSNCAKIESYQPLASTNSEIYTITAQGIYKDSTTVLRSLTVVTTAPPPEKHKRLQRYSLMWNI